MKILQVYCAGAAKAVVSRVIAAYRKESGQEVEETYGAVGFLKDRMLAGGQPDMVVLSAPLIQELTISGRLRAGSSALGAVGTGVAVRAGRPLPAVATEEALRRCLLQAPAIICPDPAVASAGQVLMQALAQLGIADEVAGRMEYSASGYAGMDRLASGQAEGEVGIMQVSEIVAYAAVSLAGSLPASLQKMTLYTAALASDADATASVLFDRLTGAREELTRAGFQSV